MSPLDGNPFPDIERLSQVANRAFELELRHGEADPEAILEQTLRHVFPGRCALVSSFGSESAVLLHMVAQIDPATPVLFLDTGKLFPETLSYRDRLVAKLGLMDIRLVRPDPRQIAREDADGFLFQRDPERCCALRKVAPLARALTGFDAWITGRKTYQGGERNGLRVFESDGSRVKVNPLAHWTKEDIERYFHSRELPRHPLEAEGYLSIGCMPCTDRARPDEDARAGRWRGLAKTECGIHRKGRF